MKHLRRTLSLLVVLLLIASTLTAGGLAETVSKVITLKTDTWITATRHARQMPAYKLTLAQDSVVTVSWRNANKKSLFAWTYTNKDCTGTNYCANNTSTVSGTNEYALAKGSYYVQIYDYNDNSQMRFTVSPVKKTGVTNYCAATAASLKAGKTVLVAQSADYNHARWFKVKLSKAKKLRVTTDPTVSNITIYNSKLDTVPCANRTGFIQSNEKLPKGTYYIKVAEFNAGSVYYHRGRVFRMKWN